jgi:hypothetical protein
MTTGSDPDSLPQCCCDAGRMTVRDLLAALQVLPRDAELLAFEAGTARTTANAKSMTSSGKAAGSTCIYAPAAPTRPEARRRGSGGHWGPAKTLARRLALASGSGLPHPSRRLAGSSGEAEVRRPWRSRALVT